MSLLTSAQAGNVNFASQYGIDKIVGIFSGSFNGATDTTNITYTFSGFPNTVPYFIINHNFGVPVFCDVLWSSDNVNYVSGQNGGQGMIAFSDLNKIYLQSPTASNVTWYYKLVCSWIDNFDVAPHLITPVVPSDNVPLFDSRQNYQKVFAQNVVTMAASPGSPDTIRQDITHNFGYRPNAKMYIEGRPGQVWPANIGGTKNFFYVSDDQCTGTVVSDLNTITLRMEFMPTTCRVWYRIYIDQ